MLLFSCKKSDKAPIPIKLQKEIPPKVKSNKQDQNLITWGVLHLPPFMILEGEQKGRGSMDGIFDLAKKHLPEYKHKTEKMNWARFWNEVANGRSVCSVMALKNSWRLEKAYFSLPQMPLLTNTIIMNKKGSNLLGNPEKYSIVKLLKDKRFKGRIEKSRSYSKSLNELLKVHGKEFRLERQTTRPLSLIKMLEAERIDYTIEYPGVANYLDNNYTETKGDIVIIPIKETPAYNFSYTVCTKNEWGKKIIGKWNKRIAPLRETKEYRKIIERSFTGEKQIQMIRKHYNDFLKQK